MSDSVEFEHVDVFTTGALGAPGRRVFYLQARVGNRVASVRCEKQQAAAIAQYLRRALAHLPIIEGGRFPESMALTPPDDEPFVLGSVGLEFRKESDLFTLVLREFDTDDVTDEDEDGDDDSDDLFGEDDEVDEGRTVRVSITRNQALTFCDHTDKIVAAGRPDCEYCKRPVDPDGHFCPRMN